MACITQRGFPIIFGIFGMVLLLVLAACCCYNRSPFFSFHTAHAHVRLRIPRPAVFVFFLVPAPPPIAAATTASFWWCSRSILGLYMKATKKK